MAARKPAEGDEKKVEKGQLQVSAALVSATTDDGKVVHLYRGDIVPSSVSKKSLEHLRSIGFVTDGDPSDDDN